MSFVLQEDHELGLSQAIRRERILISIILIFIVGFMVFDLLDDWYEGISFHHLIPEALIAFFGMGTVTFLLLRLIGKRHVALSEARQEVLKARKQATEWQMRASTFRKGLTEAISKQLNEWGFTQTEQDICFLILKGLSLQEIATMRNTSERTVRQQASVLYRKSNLSGRIELAAYFLEDLLGPSGQSGSGNN